VLYPVQDQGITYWPEGEQRSNIPEGHNQVIDVAR
jgi:hypothetical protein